MKQSMKTKYKPTQVALAYAPRSARCHLYTPNYTGVPDGLPMRVGCFDPKYPKTKEGVGRFWMVHFHHAVVRDGVDALTLHKKLLDILEYRDLCSYDVPFVTEAYESDSSYDDSTEER